MLSEGQFKRALQYLPILAFTEEGLKREFIENTSLVKVPIGRDVFTEGDRIDSIPLLISGVVRVYQIGATGREVTLYRFRPGESCVLTANAILSQQSFPAIATVEQEAEAIMIPAEVFSDWVDRYQPWRNFYFDLVAQRLASVMQLVDEVAFRRMDQRIAAILLQRAKKQNPVLVTHQEIADELGSSREVISRILDDLASQALIQTGRGQIEIVDEAKLEKLSAW
jgi:CRP/FNR family transcriptional regulator